MIRYLVWDRQWANAADLVFDPHSPAEGVPCLVWAGDLTPATPELTVGPFSHRHRQSVPRRQAYF